MVAWVVLVTYKDNTNNISQEGYRTYHDANLFVESRIKPEYRKAINDYVTVDLEKSIIYELKTIIVRGYENEINR